MRQEIPADNGVNKLPHQQLAQAEKDVKLAIDSGYEPEAFGTLDNVVITADLQHFINEQKLKVSLRESEEEQTIKLREEREEKREQSAQAAIDELSDSEKREKYLNESHAFGDIELTGRQWAHVASYAKKNRERLTEQWLEEGMDRQDAEDTFKVIEIMERGPANKEEKAFVAEKSQNPQIKSRVESVVDESGFDVEKARSQAPTAAQAPENPKVAYEPAL